MFAGYLVAASSLGLWESEKREQGGVGLVLDTRINRARTSVRQLERQLKHLTDDAGVGQEMQDIGSAAKSEEQKVREKLAAAIVEEGAARDDDYVVVEKQHVEGSAYKSGEIENGDAVIAVNGTTIGTEIEVAGGLIRGNIDTPVELTIRKASTGQERVVKLVRLPIPNHPTQYRAAETGK